MEQKFFQGKYAIINKNNIARNCYSFTIYCPQIAAIAVAGQFAHILVDGFSLRRPISICEVDKACGTIRLVFEVRGQGTSTLANSNENTLIDIIAPLGKGFTLLGKSAKIIAIGGGIGTPPILEVVKHYEKPTAIIGFRSANAVILDKDFSTYAKTIVCTDDGTMGTKGFVTAALEAELNTYKADIIYACGPHAMLKGICETAKKYNIPVQVSLEERMACGVGACLVCACRAVKDGEEYFAHVCKDGPVFNAEEVVL